MRETQQSTKIDRHIDHLKQEHDNLDKEITNLQQLKDCRIDPKQQYRMKKSL